MKALMDRIIVDPKIMACKPIIKGTRIPVDAIIKRIADGMTIDEIPKEYPNLTKEDIEAANSVCLNFRKKLAKHVYL